MINTMTTKQTVYMIVAVRQYFLDIKLAEYNRIRLKYAIDLTSLFQIEMYSAHKYNSKVKINRLISDPRLAVCELYINSLYSISLQKKEEKNWNKSTHSVIFYFRIAFLLLRKQQYNVISYLTLWLADDVYTNRSNVCLYCEEMRCRKRSEKRRNDMITTQSTTILSFISSSFVSLFFIFFFIYSVLFLILDDGNIVAFLAKSIQLL